MITDRVASEVGRRPVGHSSRPFPSGDFRGGGAVAEVEIGMGKSGRRAYGLDEVADRPEPPHPRPRGRRPVLGDRRLPRSTLPVIASAMDGVVSPATAIELRAASAPSARCTSRACGPATRTPSRCSTRSPTAPDDKVDAAAAGDLRRAGQARADRRSGSREIRERRASIVVRRGHARTGPRRCADAHHRAPSSTCWSSRARSCRPSTSPTAPTTRSTSRRSSARSTSR